MIGAPPVRDGVYLDIVFQGQKLSHRVLLNDIPMIGGDRDLMALQLVDYTLDQVVREVKAELRRMERG